MSAAKGRAHRTRHEQRLQDLGEFLKAFRRAAYHESQANFAKRLGVTVSTLRAMEVGAPGSAIGTWMLAFQLMGVADPVVSLVRRRSSYRAAVPPVQIGRSHPEEGT